MNEQQEQLPLPIDLGDGESPVGVWIEMNSAMKFWSGSYAGKWKTPQEILLTNALTTYRARAAKLRVFPARRWEMISDGTGWTSLSVALLSWCDEVDFETVLQKWRSLGELPETGVAQDFPALLLNPNFVPENNLRSIISKGKDEIGVAFLLASSLEPVVIDILEAKINDMPQRIQQMIAARVEPSATSRASGMFHA